MEEAEEIPVKIVQRHRNWKRLILLGGFAAAYSCGAMYMGDEWDVAKRYTSISDRIHSVETANGFAPYASLDFVTIVNERGERETFLAHERFESERQLTAINENGYCIPKAEDAIGGFVRERKEGLEKLRTYERLEKLKDRLELTMKYLSIKVKEGLDKVF